MVLLKAGVLLAALRSPAARPFRSTARIRLGQQITRRGYASHGGHGPKPSSSDLPWAIGAIVVTVPSCAYLLQSSPKEDHGHGHGNEGHGEHGEHKEHEEQSESEGDGEKSTEKGGDDDANAESKDSEGKEKSSDDTGSDEGHDKSEDSDSDEDKKQDTPDTSDDESSKNEVHEAEGGGDVEGVQFKGPTKGGPEGDTRKHVPDAKGGNKKRIESDYGKRQGTSDDQPQRDSGGSQKDKAAASKPALSENQQSGKQEGLSNADTKHSTNITDNPETSTKGEGTPETSKSKGTVDPSRPQK